MSETPFPWDRLPAETPKSHAAFLAYIALGARRSVREAARQAHQGSIKTVSSSTIVSRWLGWSAKHKWVSRADARDKWIAITRSQGRSCSRHRRRVLHRRNCVSWTADKLLAARV